MATGRVEVNTGNSPRVSEPQGGSVASPARGKETAEDLRNKLIASRLQLVHVWDFWHDRQQDRPDSQATAGAEKDSRAKPKYEARLVKLHSEIRNIKTFWQVFNSFEDHLRNLKHRDSIHLFHAGVKPVWEDPRNVKGGSWTFRVPKEKAPQFWKEICTLAVGEILQEAVQTQRQSFKDDICGVSYSVRFTSILITVWNRDGENKSGVDSLLKAVMDNISPELRLNQNQIYYKKHSEHAGYTGIVD